MISSDEDPIPPDLNELWSAGFKCFLTIVSATEAAKNTTPEWTKRNQAIITLVPTTPDVALADLLSRYELAFPDKRRIADFGTVRETFRSSMSLPWTSLSVQSWITTR